MSTYQSLKDTRAGRSATGESQGTLEDPRCSLRKYAACTADNCSEAHTGLGHEQETPFTSGTLLEFVKLIIDLKGRTATVRWHIARGSTAGSETADC